MAEKREFKQISFGPDNSTSGSGPVPKTKREIEGLIKLFLADGLPPNIIVRRVPVEQRPGGGLVLSVDHSIFNNQRPSEPTPEQAKAISLQQEDIPLEEVEVDGLKFLAGFSRVRPILALGYLEPLRP